VAHERQQSGLRTLGGVLVALTVAIGGCRRGEPAYVPGLGEIMTLNQMRHAKLWFAGQAGNWPLAAYELDELEEGFENAVRFHPTQEGSPISIAEVVPLMTRGPVKDLRAAIDRRDPTAFTEAFDALTAACNGCHQATNFGFNVVTRPTGNAFFNQNFAPLAAPR
jgi:hypothetical protein